MLTQSHPDIPFSTVLFAKRTCKCTHACMQTHAPSTFNLQEQGWLFVTQTCLRKHLPNWLRSKGFNTGVITVCVNGAFFAQKIKWCYQQLLQPFLFAFTSVWSPGIAQRQDMRGREGETYDERWRGKKKKRERQWDRPKQSVRHGHVRFPAPQLAPLHTNSELEMNCLICQVTVNLMTFTWLPDN